MRVTPGHPSIESTRLRTAAARLALAAALLLPAAGWAGQVRAADREFAIDVASVAELSGLTAVVSADGDGVNLRAEPRAGSEVLDTLADGTVVALRVDRVDTVLDGDGTRWWPVRSDGTDGWVSGAFLADSNGAAATDDGATAPADAGDTPQFAKGDYVSVDSSDGLAMRSGPSRDEDRLAALGDGDTVQVMDGPFWDDNGEGWYLVTDGDISAYVFAAYLTAAKAPAEETPAPEAAFGPGDEIAPAIGSGGVNIRSRASINSRRLGAINEGTAVTVVDVTFAKDGSAWYLVESGDVQGYVLGDYVVDAATVPQAPAAPATGPTGRFIYPLANYTFTQSYGCTGFSVEPYDANLGCNFHNGIDLAAPAYTPIMAADGGTVVYAGWCDCGLGYYVEIDHGNGFSTVYGHMAEQPYVVTGQQVNQGDVIGPVGSTGWSTGPHVHFMVKVNGSTVDPLGYL